MTATATTARHEPARNSVSKPLNRARDSLRLRDELNDPGQDRVAADRRRFDQQCAGGVDGAAMTFAALFLAHGNRLAVTMGFVDIGTSFNDDFHRRHFLAGPDAQPVACSHSFERNILFRAISRDPARCFRREAKERLIAPEVCSRARSSRTWPSSTRTVMTAAASK